MRARQREIGLGDDVLAGAELQELLAPLTPGLVRDSVLAADGTTGDLAHGSSCGRCRPGRIHRNAGHRQKPGHRAARGTSRVFGQSRTAGPAFRRTSIAATEPARETREPTNASFSPRPTPPDRYGRP